MRIWNLITAVLFASVAFGQTGDDYYRRALEFKEQNDFENAIVYIRHALLFDSTNIDYYDLKGDCYQRMHKYDEALLTYADGLKKDPTASLLYFRRGYLLLQAHQFNESKIDFSKFLELSNNDSLKIFAYLYRAGAKKGVRDFHGSYDDLMISYKMDSTNLLTLSDLGGVCDDIGKMDEAIMYLLRAIEIKPDFVPAINNLGFKYQQLEQHEKAITYFGKVLDLNPGEPYGYSNRSYSRYKLGDIKGALEDINRSINIYPGNSYAYRVRALVYIEMKDMTNACADIHTALEKGFTGRYGDEVEKLQKKYCN